jgi:hypothetical protein
MVEDVNSLLFVIYVVTISIDIVLTTSSLEF